MEIPELTRSEPVFELLPDPTPILTIPPDDPEPEYTEAQLEYKRKKDKATRCKTIVMDEMGLDPAKSHSCKAEKFLILKEVEKWFEKPDEEIQAKFNEVCSKMFECDDPKRDYTHFAIYKDRIPT